LFIKLYFFFGGGGVMGFSASDRYTPAAKSLYRINFVR
jgi:hypothetical protein